MFFFLFFFTIAPLPPIARGLLTRVMVLVTPPTTVVTTWACWETVTVPDLCTVMMGLVVVGEDAVAVPTCAAAVFSIRVAGLLTCLSTHRYLAMWCTGCIHCLNVPLGLYHDWRSNFHSGGTRSHSYCLENSGTCRNIENCACWRGWDLLCCCCSCC